MDARKLDELLAGNSQLAPHASKQKMTVLFLGAKKAKRSMVRGE